MRRQSGVNVLLTEILIAVLFFALCATVILEAFSATHTLNVRAERTDNAMRTAQNLAETLWTQKDADTVLQTAGFALEGGEYVLELQDGVWLCFTQTEETSDAGVLARRLLTVLVENETVAQIPCSRYFPLEGGDGA